MRLEHWGYKAIATYMGISRDRVRSYCDTIGLKGNCAEFTPKNDLRNNPTFCRNCGKPINQNSYGRKKKFCCEACRRAWWKEHPKKNTKRMG